MVSPADFYQYLAALKDAGAIRAKIGSDCFEVEFASEGEPTVEVEAPQHPTTQKMVASEPQPRAGYSALFSSPPRFTPADE